MAQFSVFDTTKSGGRLIVIVDVEGKSIKGWKSILNSNPAAYDEVLKVLVFKVIA